MPKRRRESNISFDNDGCAIIESDGLKFKWHIPKEIKHDLKIHADDYDISVIVTVSHKFMVDIRNMRTDKVIISEFVEML